MSEFQFKDRMQFGQAAFDYVAQVVSNHAEQILVGGNCSPTSEQCLHQLEFVASVWGLDNSRIRAHHEMISEANADIKEMLLSLGDHDD